jgi:hypothetical protein
MSELSTTAQQIQKQYDEELESTINSINEIKK